MQTTQIFIEKFDYFFKWETIKYAAVLSNENNAEKDIEKMMVEKKSFLNQELEFYPNDREKANYIATLIKNELAWLKVRRGAIYLLDGRLNDLIELATDITKMISLDLDKSTINSIIDIKDWIDNQSPIEIKITFDDSSEHKVTANVKMLGSINFKKILTAFLGYNNIIKFSTESERVVFPKEIIMMLKKILWGVLTRNKEFMYEAPKIIFKPLVFIQFSREYLAYLILLQNGFENETVGYSIPEWIPNKQHTPSDKQIIIKLDCIKFILSKLEPYFSDEDIIILDDILKGTRTGSQRIHFKGAGAKIGYLFKQLHDLEVITSLKQNTELILVKYISFDNAKSKEKSNFTSNMAHNYISRNTPLKGKDIIDISEINKNK